MKSFWRVVHPEVPLKLLLVILFLLLIALASGFSCYDNAASGNAGQAGLAALGVCLYALPAAGLARLRSWARKFEIGFSAFWVIIGGIILVYYSLWEGSFIIATHGSVALYLLSHECRELFLRHN